MHFTTEFGGIGGNLPKDSVNQKEGKPMICSPLPQCVQYSYLNHIRKKMEVEFLSLGSGVDSSNANNSQIGNINE